MKLPNNLNYTFQNLSLSATYIACLVFEGLVSVKGLLNKVPDSSLWFPLENQGTWGERSELSSFNEGCSTWKTRKALGEYRTPHAALTITVRWEKWAAWPVPRKIKGQCPSDPLIIFAVLWNLLLDPKKSWIQMVIWNVTIYSWVMNRQVWINWK